MSAKDAALAYAASGLTVGPVRKGTKHPGSLLGDGWPDKTSRDPEVIERWFAKSPDAGVFIHTGPSHLVVFDLDKTEDLNDLPQEIATALRTGVFHQSRPKGERGHYIFTTEERLGNAAGGFAAWGDVRAGNGVIIAAPTLHAQTGEPYRLVKGGAVPQLPAHLRGLLRAGGADAVSALTPEQVKALRSRLTTAKSPSKLQAPVSAFRQRVEAGESRHGALVAVLPWAFREAKDGLYSAQNVIDTFRDEFAASFADSGEGQRSTPGQNEFENLVAWAAAQPTPAQLAETLWEKSEELGLVRRWAQERFITPWSLLGVGLLRALCAVPPSHVLPGIVGAAAQPNLFLGLVGESGTGKGLAERVAGEVFRLQGAAFTDLYPGKPGSGEGIPKMFGNHRGKEGVVYEHTRVLMSMPEVDSLKSLFKRDSSTLSATLRELWSGETLGNDYSGVGNKVLVRLNRYRACLVVGVQPARGGPLFEDAEGGLPQRFVFVATQDPEIALPTGNVEDLRPIFFPVWESERTEAWLLDMGNETDASELTEFTVPAFVVTEVRAGREMRMRGQSGALDGHRLLLQEKVALGFAVLHGVSHGFETEHWEMAELLMAHSDAVREKTLSALTEVARSVREGRARAEGRAEVVRDAAREEELRATTRDRIRAKLADGKPVGTAALVRNLSKAQKDVAPDVLNSMVEKLEVTRTKATSGPSTGFKYRAVKP